MTGCFCYFSYPLRKVEKYFTFKCFIGQIMCGRFANFRKSEEMKEFFPIDKADFGIIENASKN